VGWGSSVEVFSIGAPLRFLHLPLGCSRVWSSLAWRGRETLLFFAESMPVATFATSQPWGSAAQHQRDHPGAWTPELTETTASWTEVVRAVVQAQEDLVQGSLSSFRERCAGDAALRGHLDLLSERGLHDLLIAWIMEGVRERISVFAVPNFWQRYHEAMGTAPPSSASGSGRMSASLERPPRVTKFKRR
jgi:hypothetical protein